MKTSCELRFTGGSKKQPRDTWVKYCARDRLDPSFPLLLMEAKPGPVPTEGVMYIASGVGLDGHPRKVCVSSWNFSVIPKLDYKIEDFL